MKICVFGASSDNLSAEYYEAAEKMGSLIAKYDNTLVFGGGKDGLMGFCALGAEKTGGHITGFAPSFFDEPGILYKNSGELVLTDTMEERKKLMIDKSDAFVVLPGGLGTFEEFFACLTLKQLGRHAKPVVLLNTLDYFQPLYALIEHSVTNKFAGSDTASLFTLCDTPEQAMEYIENYIPVSGSTKRICEYCR